MKHPPVALSLAVMLFAATCSATSTEKITAFESKIPASEAKNHMGQTATVCGVVASARNAVAEHSKTWKNEHEPESVMSASSPQALCDHPGAQV